MAEEEKDFVIDFAGLDYISSAGLRVILATTKKLKEKEGKLLLSSLKDIVKEVFEISGFTAIIPIYDSVETALTDNFGVNGAKLFTRPDFLGQKTFLTT